jgi:hypothetical protein
MLAAMLWCLLGRVGRLLVLSVDEETAGLGLQLVGQFVGGRSAQAVGDQVEAQGDASQDAANTRQVGRCGRGQHRIALGASPQQLDGIADHDPVVGFPRLGHSQGLDLDEHPVRSG